MKVNPPFYCIKVTFPSGNVYYYGETKDGRSTLHFKEEDAMPFLTQGSGERFVEKLKTVMWTDIAKRLTFEVLVKGEKKQ